MESYAELKSKYPRLIPARFGFSCEIGWLAILDRYFAVVDRELPDNATYELRQIKEKMGGLRIYDHCAATAKSVAIDEAHNLAYARSHYVCEYCGKPGRYSKRGTWFTTVCEDHAVLHGYRAEPCDDEGYYIRDGSGAWKLYSPELDSFVETEAPSWAR